MKLVIVESPKKCETIKRYLGAGYEVMASQGHIRDLSTRGKGGLGIDINAGFAPDYEISKGKQDIVRKLTLASRKADEVLLATDPDREGEAISWHLAQILNLPIATTKRLRFHEITRDGITGALENPSHIDQNLVHAQEARRMEDRIIGFKVSDLMKRRTGVESAGRVQSATLGMIVERQEAIDAFHPEEYWTIAAIVKIGGKEYKANLEKVDGKKFKCSSKAEADAILARMPALLNVAKVEQTEKPIYPKMAFTTSSMQQEAFNRFHFSNKKTQSVAQMLYEGKSIGDEHVGLITYMRTDSTRISPVFFKKHAEPFILEQFGKEYVGSLRDGKKKENIQDAHEAIRPTGTHRTPEKVAPYLTADEAKLYRLIYCRAMASLMAPKRVMNTSVVLEGNGLEFSLKGTRTLFKGFEVIYGEFEDEEEVGLLPEIKEGENFERSGVDAQQKFTKPEPQYNEASIVKAMEEKGIGRPSTYATTIDTIIKRHYVTATKGTLAPTELGIKAVHILAEHFPDVVSTEYTARMENDLDKVERGESTFKATMDEFYEPFSKNFEAARENLKKEPDKETGELCPKCGHPLVYKRNRSGQEFVACSNYPSCKYVQNNKPEPEYTGNACPECGKPLVYKVSRKGEKFIGCSNFPACRYTANLDGSVKAKKEKAGYQEADFVKPCPKCKTGHLVIKKGKRAEFLGCTNFPRCHYHEWLTKKGDEKKN